MNIKAYIFDFIALAIVVWIYAFNKDLKRSKRLDDRYFKRLGATVFLVIICDIVSVYVDDNVEHKLGDIAFIFLNDLIPIIYSVNCLNWLKFIDAAVNNNDRAIKEKYRYYYAPIVFLVVLMGTWRLIYDYATVYLHFLFFVVYVAGHIGIPAFFMYKAFSMARKYQKELKNPLLLRLDIFIIPWIIGVFATRIDLDPMCQTIGLLLAFAFLKKRGHYLDEDMLFYNENFVDFLDDYDKKHGFSGGYAMILYSENEDILAESIRQCVSEKSLVVRTNEKYFIIYTHIRLKSAIQVFIITVQDNASKKLPDINIEADYLLQGENESIKAITERLKARFKTYDRISHM